MRGSKNELLPLLSETVSAREEPELYCESISKTPVSLLPPLAPKNPLTSASTLFEIAEACKQASDPILNDFCKGILEPWRTYGLLDSNYVYAGYSYIVARLLERSGCETIDTCISHIRGPIALAIKNSFYTLYSNLHIYLPVVDPYGFAAPEYSNAPLKRTIIGRMTAEYLRGLTPLDEYQEIVEIFFTTRDLLWEHLATFPTGNILDFPIYERLETYPMYIEDIVSDLVYLMLIWHAHGKYIMYHPLLAVQKLKPCSKIPAQYYYLHKIDPVLLFEKRIISID